MELVERARAGDEDAFQQLIDAHKTPVFRLAYLMLRNAQDAEDITQETFLQVYRSLHRFDPERPFRPWVMQIAANLCRNHQRGWSRYWKALLKFAGEGNHDYESAEQVVRQHADVQHLLDAVEQLRPQEREIIYLRYFLEMDVHSTADMLKIQPGTVKSRLHRALKELEQVLKANE